MVLTVGKRFGMVDVVVDREGLLEEVYRVVNKVGDTEPTHAICLADGRSFMADRGFDGNVGKRHLVQLGQLQMKRAVADDLRPLQNSPKSPKFPSRHLGDFS